MWLHDPAFLSIPHTTPISSLAQWQTSRISYPPPTSAPVPSSVRKSLSSSQAVVPLSANGKGWMSFDVWYEEDSSSPPSALGRRNLILSVDSHSGVLFARYKLLSAAGYAVMSTTDGVRALQLFGSYPVDLVLLDYVLPELDGGSIAHAMKEYEPNVPIIMLSGAEVPGQCLAAVNLHLRKAEKPEALLGAIRELMASSIRIRVGWRKAG